MSAGFHCSCTQMCYVRTWRFRLIAKAVKSNCSLILAVEEHLRHTFPQMLRPPDALA